jgi:hypothetical protein
VVYHASSPPSQSSVGRHKSTASSQDTTYDTPRYAD